MWSAKCIKCKRAQQVRKLLVCDPCFAKMVGRQRYEFVVPLFDIGSLQR